MTKQKKKQKSLGGISRIKMIAESSKCPSDAKDSSSIHQKFTRSENLQPVTETLQLFLLVCRQLSTQLLFNFVDHEAFVVLQSLLDVHLESNDIIEHGFDIGVKFFS